MKNQKNLWFKLISITQIRSEINSFHLKWTPQTPDPATTLSAPTEHWFQTYMMKEESTFVHHNDTQSSVPQSLHKNFWLSQESKYQICPENPQAESNYIAIFFNKRRHNLRVRVWWACSISVLYAPYHLVHPRHRQSSIWCLVDRISAYRKANQVITSNNK